MAQASSVCQSQFSPSPAARESSATGIWLRQDQHEPEGGGINPRNRIKTEKVDLELETQKKTMPITRYIYKQNGKTVVLHFQNGRLINEPEQMKEQ